ncbi:MAG: hypothetical protein ACYC38_07935 [Eubacteriales bacterium]
MAVMIAQEIGQYLQNIGEGTLGVDILVDLQPGAPDNIISIYDKGGPASQDPPEDRRELYIQDPVYYGPNHTITPEPDQVYLKWEARLTDVMEMIFGTFIVK